MGLALMAPGCGAGAAGPPAGAPRAADATVSGAASALPSTAGDPPPPSHPVRAEATTAEGPVGVRLGGPTGRAIDTALAVLEAILRADRDTLERLLAPSVARVQGGFRNRIDRDDLVAGFARWASARSRLGRSPGGRPEDYVDPAGVTVASVAETFGTLPPNAPVDADDLVVRVPLRDPGDGTTGLRVPGWGWRNTAILVVRAGPSPAVVAF